MKYKISNEIEIIRVLHEMTDIENPAFKINLLLQTLVNSHCDIIINQRCVYFL